MKHLVNEALRTAPKRSAARRQQRSNFRTKSVDLGRCLLPNFDDEQ
jgi:hypothetical protein